MTTKNSFIQDIFRLEKLYTSTKIVEQLKRAKEKISNDVCEIVAERYSIPIFYWFEKNIALVGSSKQNFVQSDSRCQA